MDRISSATPALNIRIIEPVSSSILFNTGVLNIDMTITELLDLFDMIKLKTGVQSKTLDFTPQ